MWYDLPYLPQQLKRHDRFSYYFNIGTKLSFTQDYIAGMAADKNEFHAFRHLPYFVVRCLAALAGHNDIGNHQLNFVFPGGKFFHGILTIYSGYDGVTGPCQKFFQSAAGICVVFCHQNCP